MTQRHDNFDQSLFLNILVTRIALAIINHARAPEGHEPLTDVFQANKQDYMFACGAARKVLNAIAITARDFPAGTLSTTPPNP